jgi:hypothetical protein
MTLAVFMIVLLGACGESGSIGAGPDGRREPGPRGDDEWGNFGAVSVESASTSDEACASTTVVAEPRPVHLVFMFDRSGSMAQGGSPKWQSCKAAAKAFFTSPDSAGIGASLSFFPQGSDGCDNELYRNPSVPMTTLPTTTLGKRLDDTDTGGDTPMRHALQGATRYAATVADGQGREGTVAVVLVTDGLPTSCGNNELKDVRDVANAAASKTPTYVIGVGDLEDLNGIAKAGGTDKALLVPANEPKQIEQAFLKALERIRLSAIPCDFAIPPPPTGEELDQARVNVVYTPKGAAAEPLLHDASCARGAGWGYDDRGRPKRIVLCESTCGKMKGTTAKLDIAFGCATRTVPVK